VKLLLIQEMLKNQIDLANKLKEINSDLDDKPEKIKEYLESSKALSLAISNIYELKRTLWRYNFMTEEWIDKSEKNEKEKLVFVGGNEPKLIPEEINVFEVKNKDGITVLKAKDNILEILKGYTVNIITDEN
jgi:hypothetical protein